MITIINQIKADKTIIEEFQTKNKLKLPNDYFVFLEDFNGGEPEPNIVKMDKESELETKSTSIDSFFGFGLGYDDISNQYELHEKILPKNSLPICSTVGGNLLLISLSAENYGEIYFWDHEIATEGRAEISELQYISDSFSGFLESVQPDNDEADLTDYEVEEMWIHPDFDKYFNGE